MLARTVFGQLHSGVPAVLLCVAPTPLFTLQEEIRELRRQMGEARSLKEESEPE